MTAVSLVRIEVAASIAEIDRAQWDALAGPADFCASSAWLGAVERDRAAKPRYLQAFAGGRLVGAMPVYRVLFEEMANYQPDRYRDALGLDGTYLVAGGRRGNRGTVLIDSAFDHDHAGQVTHELLAAATGIARDDGRDGIVFLFLPATVLASISRIASVTAVFEDAEAVITGADQGIERYLARFRRKARLKRRREMDAFAAAPHQLTVEPLSACHAEAAGLIANVQRQHGHPSRPRGVQRVLEHQARSADRHSVVFCCRAGGRLVACSLGYIWKGALHMRAVGFDYEALDDAAEYFNLLIYAPLDYAAGHGIRSLNLGIKSSEAKALRGAQLRPLWSAAVHQRDLAGSWPPTGQAARGRLRLVSPDRHRDYIQRFGAYPQALAPGDWQFPAVDRPRAVPPVDDRRPGDAQPFRQPGDD